MTYYIQKILKTGHTQKKLELINEFSKVEYKISIQKSVAFLWINSELSEREIRKTIPFKTASGKIKYLRNKFDQGSERPVY